MYGDRDFLAVNLDRWMSGYFHAVDLNPFIFVVMVLTILIVMCVVKLYSDRATTDYNRRSPRCWAVWHFAYPFRLKVYSSYRRVTEAAVV